MKQLLPILALLSATACAAHGPINTTPTNPAIPTTLNITVRGVADPTTVSVDVTPDERTADAGVLSILPDGGARLVMTIPTADTVRGGYQMVSAPGYISQRTRLAIDGCASTIPIPAFGPHELCEVTLQPLFMSLPRLTMRTSEFFGLDNGSRYFILGHSDFPLFKKYLEWKRGNGPPLDDLLRDRAGFNELRVWTLGNTVFSDGNTFRLIPSEYPEFYDSLVPFVRLCATYGFRVEFTAFTGARTLMPLLADQQSHLDQLEAVAFAETNVSVEVGNEYEQGDNQWLFDQLHYRSDIIISAGSAGSLVWPSVLGLPVLTYEEYHDNDADEWQRRGSHEAMEMSSDNHRPVKTNEQTKTESDDDAITHYADSMRACKLLNAGCYLHDFAGRTSDLFNDVQRAVVSAIFAATSEDQMPLRCQDAGGYVHGAAEIALEIAQGLLRDYQRGNDPACNAPIKH